MTPHGIRPDWAVKPLRFLTAPSGVFQRGFILPSPSMIMAGVIIALSLSNVLFFNLWQGAKNEYALYVAKVDAASAQADAENQRRLADAERATGDVGRLYGEHINNLERDYSSRLKRLRGEIGNRQTLSRTAEATKGVDVRPANDGLDRAYIEACDRLEKDCSVTTLKWYHLKRWVIGVCK